MESLDTRSRIHWNYLATLRCKYVPSVGEADSLAGSIVDSGCWSELLLDGFTGAQQCFSRGPAGLVVREGGGDGDR